MWVLVSLISTTAVLQRTEALQTPINGDHWWTQNHNRRRIGIALAVPPRDTNQPPACRVI
jgi:hypothetical protein